MPANIKLLTLLLIAFIQARFSLAVPVQGPVEARTLHTCAIL